MGLGNTGILFLGAHRDLGGSCSLLSTGSSSPCIPSGHQSQGKEDTAVPREGLVGGWATLARSPGSSGAVPCFSGISSQGRGGRGGEGGAGRGGSESDPWPCLALPRSRRLAEAEGGRGVLLLGEKKRALSS